MIAVSIYYMEFIYLMIVQLIATFTLNRAGVSALPNGAIILNTSQQFVVIHVEASATFTVSVFHAFLGNVIMLGCMM